MFTAPSKKSKKVAPNLEDSQEQLWTDPPGGLIQVGNTTVSLKISEVKGQIRDILTFLVIPFDHHALTV